MREQETSLAVDDMSPGETPGQPRNRFHSVNQTWWRISLLAAWQIALLTAVILETSRLKARLLSENPAGAWWQAIDPDSTLMLPWLFLAPFCWGFPFQQQLSTGRISRFLVLSGQKLTKPVSFRFRMMGLLLVGSISLITSEWSAQLPVPGERDAGTIQQVLPLVQDELSYELQARSFLQGRWSWPGPSRTPELFHQMHVLNDGRFASRYFPGTGLWFAPWLALGEPVWGARLAGALISISFFLMGCELKNGAVGLLAGGLVAVSPSLAIISNLQLSHGPCLTGIAIFLLAFLLFMNRPGCLLAGVAGCGLSFAMLCRPLTAAAIGLPFGLWFFQRWFRALKHSSSTPVFLQHLPQRRSGFLRWSLAAFCLGIPLLAGLILIAIQNQALTDDPFLTAYQLYNQRYTPRHAFGFFQANATSTSPETLHAYNEWATQLDLTRGAENLLTRLRGSLSWNLGLIPLSLSGVFCLLTFFQQQRQVQLLLCSIFALHLAHLPYWLSGMLEHHYVFESGPIWILIFALISYQLIKLSIDQQRWLYPCWWTGLVFLSVSINLFSIRPGEESRLLTGWRTFTQPTTGYRAFLIKLNETPVQRPALILVQPGPGDLHAQFVRNLPPFHNDLLIATDRPELYSIEEVQTAFPERTLYRYHSATRSLIPVFPAQLEVSP